MCEYANNECIIFRGDCLMHGDLGTRMDDAVGVARDAFWASIAESYPEITTGDLDPLIAYHFEQQAKMVVRRWVMVNLPPLMLPGPTADELGRIF